MTSDRDRFEGWLDWIHFQVGVSIELSVAEILGLQPLLACSEVFESRLFDLHSLMDARCSKKSKHCPPVSRTQITKSSHQS